MNKGVFKDHDITTPFFTLKNTQTYARVVSIYDGDTMTCVIPLFENFFKFNIRLNGIDTCELRSENQTLKAKALAARQYLLNTLCGTTWETDVTRTEIERYFKNNVVLCWIVCHGEDKYGRVLADVYLSREDCLSNPDNHLSNRLITAKLAYPYAGDTKLATEQLLQLLL